MADSASKASESKRVKALWKLFEEHVFQKESQDDVFNFYKDADPEVDLEEGAEIRRRNLRGYVAQVAEPPTVFLVGEGASWRGTRFTGVPFTSQAQLLRPDFPVPGERSSLGPNPLSERTATQIWETVLPHHPRIFMWHAYPIHSHRKGGRQTDRTPSRREMDEYTDLLSAMIEVLDPEMVLALGRSAQTVLQDADEEHTYVRHPSFGGVRSFKRGMSDALEADEEEDEG